ncbi:MAG: phenylalanine--tRNA ligase subunit beta [Thaumarchaeota archaeon]|nr:phenylalanine--tRNA ligase subunit beta [Nitrososphaerota archaeon]
MPVITLNFDRMQMLMGKRIKTSELVNALTSLGLDIESQNEESVRIEYSPNRPDYGADFGISNTLKCFLNVRDKNHKNFVIEKSNYKINVSPKVKKIRPYLYAIIAKSKKTIDDNTIKQLITMQEDLHNGLGKKRKKASIGFHDFDKIAFPLVYTTVELSHKFIPLGQSIKFSIRDILNKLSVGKQYGHLVANKNAPMIIDSKGVTVSFPPIINSSYTTITNNTKSILIEVTATDSIVAEDVLSIIIDILYNAFDYKFYNVKIDGIDLSYKFKTRKMTLDKQFVNDMLGINISNNQIIRSLKKSGLASHASNKKIICTIPRSRFDIMDKVDLVEEVLIGYGVENLDSQLPKSTNLGNKNTITKYLDAITMIMIGLGYTEVLNQSLVDKKIQYFLTQQNENNLALLNSINRNYVLRNNIIPSLLHNLSKNVHNEYPQKLFEVGTTFLKSDMIEESINLACVNANQTTNFTTLKSVLQSAFKPFDIYFKTKSTSNSIFSNGRAALIICNSHEVGIIGEISKNVLNNFKIRIPVSGFEVKLTGLLF